MSRACVSALCAALALGGVAEPVAWYHFDEGAAGEAPAASGFLNAVAPKDDPGFLAAAVVRGAPTYAQGFGDGMAWVDPAARTWVKNERALDFANARLRIPDHDALRSPSATVEVFFKYAESRPGFFRLIEKWDGSAFPWLIYISGGSVLNARVATDVDGVRNDNQLTTEALPELTVGVWHHVALVIDDDARRFDLYLDHRRVGSKTYEGKRVATDVTRTAVYVGNRGSVKADGTAEGEFLKNDAACRIDELRLSNTALPPARFLHPSVGAAALNAHPETVVYLPFESADAADVASLGARGMAAGTDGLKAVPNMAAVPVSGVSIVCSADDGCATRSGDVRTPTVRRDVQAETASANAHVLRTVVCGGDESCPDRSAAIQIDDLESDAETGVRRHGALAGSFTVEFFAKFDTPSGEGGIGQDSYILRTGTKTPFNANLGTVAQADDRRLRRLNVACAGKLICSRAFACEAWHHLAFRYDQKRREAACFVDYRPWGVVSDVAFDNEGTADFLIGSAGLNGAHGLVDDVRVTRRALEPQEFLTGCGVADEAAAAWIDFEDDLLVKPYPDVAPEGAASAMPGGEMPARTAARPCRRLHVPGRAAPRANAASLALAGGQVVWGRNLTIENLVNQTVEFFLSGDDAPEGAGVLRFADGADATVWAVAAGAGGKTAVTVGETTQTFEVPLADGRWRHYALTFAAEGGGATTVTLWVDGGRVGAFAAGTLRRASDGSALTAGGGTAAFAGRIDEIRITPSVLAPREFLRADRPGLSVVVH